MDFNSNDIRNVFTLVFEIKKGHCILPEIYTFFITFVIFGWIFFNIYNIFKYIITEPVITNCCFIPKAVIIFLSFLGICFCFEKFKLIFDFIFRKKFESNTDAMSKFESKTIIEYDFKEPKTKVKYNKKENK
jgi:hypothetical protein